MRKHAAPIFTAILLASLTLSCAQETEPTDEPVSESPYVPRIEWQLETRALMSNGDILQDGRFLYAQESNYVYAREAPFLYLSKIDLSDGTYVWKTDALPVDSSTTPLKANGLVFIQLRDGTMKCYRDSDGALAATVRLGSTGEQAINNGAYVWNIISGGKKLYWGNSGNQNQRVGVMEFDTERIDLEANPATEQVIEPTFLWESVFPNVVWAKPIVQDNILYCLTLNPEYEEGTGYCTLLAVDTGSKAVMWQRKLPFVKGLVQNPLYIEGDFLHLVDFAVACFHRFTGDVIYEKVQTQSDLYHEVYLGGSWFLAGIYYIDGKLYYTKTSHCQTASMSGTPEEYNKNIVCIDAAPGAYVWGDMPPGGGSLGTRPIVANGRAYVVTDCGLRVYEAKTGKLVGVDSSVSNQGADLNALYDGKVIYFNNDKKRRIATLTAIRAD